ncbi:MULTISPECIES: hypothetical protein [Agrobacterium]|uniref:hypothetical protein n=1 Tax=Agrobacterium tumefaciens TaxID=358 RepID=UPI00157161AB|nr:hypothetical protein [Agrobacterium tumefaciens]NSZ05634.1 hypothetical protein [Agrobacterium tumefaciens]
MSSVVMYARDLVQALKGETYCLEDRNVDERDMTRQQLETLAAGFGRVAEMASKHQARLLERIQPINSTDDPFKQYGIGDAVVYHAVTGVKIRGKITNFVDGNPELTFRDGSTAVCAASRVSLASIDLSSKEKREALLDHLTGSAA